MYHNKKLIIAAPQNDAKRDETYAPDPLQQAAQKEHLARLANVERYPGFQFDSADQFTAEVWRSGLLDILIEAGLIRKVIHLPYVSLGELFKGRESLLDDLTKRLGLVPQHSDQPAVALALTGLGGVGKTRLALEYAWRHAKDYTAMLLVGADSPEVLNRNLAALCATTILDLPAKDERDESKQRDAAINWLRQHPGWLLIIDNIDAEPAATAVEALVPNLTGGHLLLTSRLPNWSPGIGALPVDLLSPAAADAFLLLRTATKRRPQPDDPAAARTLAEELGYLALALEQAGAYIVQRRLGFAQYLEEWRRQRETVLAWFDPRLMQYPKSVAITWQTSFDQLREPARKLLQRLAWLAPEPIPESLLDVPVPGQDPAQADPYGALTELESYSLVTRAADTPYFSVHRLVQEVTRRGQQNNPAHDRLAEALNWVNDAFAGDPTEVRNWPVLDPLIPHAHAVAAYADEAGIPDPTARLLNQIGTLLFQKAQYTEAEPPMCRALAISEASLGDYHPDVALRLNNLATLLQATNRLADAELLMRRALTIDKESLGADHPDVARDLSDLAQLLLATNRLADAEPLMRRALAIDEANFGDDHPKVAIALNGLATLLQATNRLDDAEPLMHRALTIGEASFGADHPNVARYLNNLAQLLQATNRLADAESLMRRALAIDETSFGVNHPDVARDLNNLAQLLKDSGRLTNAEPLLRRALAIGESSFGDYHPNIARYLNNLGQLLQATSRLVEAEPLMRRALAIDEASFGADHPAVARDLNNLAQLLKNTNRLAEAKPLMRRALMTVVKGMGTEHPHSSIARNNYIALLRAMGRTDEIIRAELASLTA